MGLSIFDQENIVSAATTFLENIGVTLPSFFTLVRVSMWITGLLLLISAIMKLRQFKEPGGAGLVPRALWQIFFAVLCLNMNSSLDVATETVFGISATSPISYPTGHGSWVTERSTMIASIVLIWIQFTGYIAFARGILILNKYKTVHPAPHGVSMAKGMTHIIGGVIACNMSLFTDYLM